MSFSSTNRRDWFADAIVQRLFRTLPPKDERVWPERGYSEADLQKGLRNLSERNLVTLSRLITGVAATEGGA